MENHGRALRIVFAIIVSLIAGNAYAQYLPNDVNGGSTGTPTKFRVENICITTDPHDTAFWDFGSGATPAKATTLGVFEGMSVSFSQNVTYSTPGDKTVTFTLVTPEGSSSTTTNTIHVYGCSTPSIPHDAIVINSDTTVTLGPVEPSRTFWVNPGVTMNLNWGSGHGNLVTVFAEPGSTISGAVYGMFYMKQGSVFTSSGGRNRVIGGGGARINPASNDFALDCPILDFDYSNAPPNAAHPLSSVKDNLKLASMTLSPNPTSGMVSVQGLPSDNISVSVFNTLGETVMVQENLSAPDFTLDLSKLVPGAYYVRFSSMNAVVAKKVVRE